MQLPYWLALEEEFVQLVVAWRLERLVAALAQPTVLGRVMHGA